MNIGKSPEARVDLTRVWEHDPLVRAQSQNPPLDPHMVHARYTEKGARVIPFVSRRKSRARGGSRTHMRKNPRRILSPQRLPFRHPGTGTTNLANPERYCNTTTSCFACTKAPGVGSGVSWTLCESVQSFDGGTLHLHCGALSAEGG